MSRLSDKTNVFSHLWYLYNCWLNYMNSRYFSTPINCPQLGDRFQFTQFRELTNIVRQKMKHRKYKYLILLKNYIRHWLIFPKIIDPREIYQTVCTISIGIYTSLYNFRKHWLIFFHLYSSLLIKYHTEKKN